LRSRASARPAATPARAATARSVIERHEPVVHEEHDAAAVIRFRDRRDPDDRLRLDLARAGDLDVLTMRNECGDARHRAALDGRREKVLK